MTRIDQYRTNPSKAVSNFKGRWDSVFAWPSTAISQFGPNGLVTGPANATRASGGTEAIYTGYKSYTFTASGTFTTAKGGLADVFLVGGGGGGGPYNYLRMGGGGGAGGVYLEEQVTLLASTAYTCTIGAAGTPGSGSVAGSGASTHFFISGGSALYGVGGGGGGGGWAAGVASPAHTDGSSDPGTGAGGGGAHLNTWAGGPQQYGGGAAGTYGGAGATSNQTGTDGSSGHGGGKVGVSPTTGTNAAGINTNQGTLNDYEEGSDLPYACGGGGVRSEGGGVFVAGYPTADYDHGSGRTGRIAGGYGGQGDTSKRSANQNTGGGGGGYYGATSGSGAAGIIVVRVAV